MRKNTNQRTEHAYTYTRKYQYISSESMKCPRISWIIVCNYVA